MPRKKYNLKLAILARFLRTIIPQIPACAVVIADYMNRLDAPCWVAPVLMFVGAIATATDKLIRELKK